MSTTSSSSSIESISEVARKVSVSIPAELVEREYRSALTKAVSKVAMKGFRPGKAPPRLVEQMHGEQVRFDVARELVSSHLENVVKEHKLEIIGAPSIDFGPLDPTKEFQFTAELALYPQPKVEGYDKFKVEVPRVAVADSAVDQSILELRESRATSRPITDRQVVQSRDVIQGTIKVAIEGEDMPERGEPLAAQVGVGKLTPELDAAIVGLALGEERTVETEMPKDHPNANLRGKKVSYQVLVASIAEQILPELDDDFVKSLNRGEAKTALELKLQIRKELEQIADRDSKGAVQTAVLKQLVERNQFLVPQVMIDNEIRSMLVRFGVIDPARMDVEKVPVDSFREKLGEIALERVRTMVAVDRISEAEKILPTDSDIDEALGVIASQHNVSIDDVRKYLLQDQSRSISLSSELMRTKTIDMLVERAKVEYVEPATDIDGEKAEKIESELGHKEPFARGS